MTIESITLDRVPLTERRSLTNTIFQALARLTDDDSPQGNPQFLQEQELRNRARQEILRGASNPANQFDAKALQNRDRSRQSYIAQMQDIAAHPDYDRISTSRIATDGAPMVFTRGVIIPADQTGKSETVTMSDGEGGSIKIPAIYAVIEAQELIASHDAGGNKVEAYGGSTGIMALNNGRTAGIKQAYDKGNADAYWQALMDDEAGHGISAVEISKMHQPVLVRVFPESAIAGIDDPGAASNDKTGAELSDSEQAQTDAKKLDESVLTQYQGGDINSAANAGFVRAFVGAVGGSKAVGNMQLKGGLISASGIKRIEGALVAKAYGDDATLTDLTESPDSELKSLGDVLKDVAGRWAVMKQAAHDGRISLAMDITPNLNEAVAMVRKARQQGVRIAELVNQADMFSGQTNPVTESLLRLMFRGDDLNRVRSADKIRAALHGFLDRAMETSAGADMLGFRVGPMALIDQQKDKLESEEMAAKSQRGLFDSAIADYFNSEADSCNYEWLCSDGFQHDIQAIMDSANIPLSERRKITRELLAGVAKLQEDRLSLTDRRKATREVLGNILRLGGEIASKEMDRQAEKMTSPSEAQPDAPEVPQLMRLTIPAKYTHDFHQSMMQAIYDNGGMVAVDDVRAAFHKISTTKDETKELLAKLKNKELEAIAGSHYKNQKKDDLVRGAYGNMVSAFAYFSGDSLSFGFGAGEREKAVKAKVDALTQEDLIKWAEDQKARYQEHRDRIAAMKKAIADPQTLEDFDYFIRFKGKEAMTPELLARYDALKAESGIATKEAQQEAKKEQAATVAGAESAISHEFADTTHSKKGTPLYVIKLTGERMDKDAFLELSKKAKKLGGWYSSFKGSGAIPGFQFTTEDDRKSFARLLVGESVDVSDKIEEREAEKQDNRASKLLEMADKLEAKANEQLSRNRLTNTARRAGMAANATNAAYEELAFAQTIRKISEKMQEGDIRFIANLSQKTQLGTLNKIVGNAAHEYISKGIQNGTIPKGRDAVESRREFTENFLNGTATPEQINEMMATVKMPMPKLTPAELAKLSREIVGIDGLKLISGRLLKLAGGSNSDDWKDAVAIPIDIAEKLVDVNASMGGRGFNLRWNIATSLDDYKRLARMGIDSDEHLRMALRELVSLKAKKQKEDPLKVLERNLIGKYKDLEWFNTPTEAARRLVMKAHLSHTHKILEPSAGLGHLADAAVSMGIPKENIDTVEISSELAEGLRLKGYNVVHQGDFLQYHKTGYDRIIMNPPFSGDKDIQHVLHAFELLKPGGRLVAIVSGMTGDRQNSKNQSFREFLDEYGIDEEALPEGSFKASINSTGVNTKIIVLDKKAGKAEEPENERGMLDSIFGGIPKQPERYIRTWWVEAA